MPESVHSISNWRVISTTVEESCVSISNKREIGNADFEESPDALRPLYRYDSSTTYRKIDIQVDE